MNENKLLHDWGSMEINQCVDKISPQKGQKIKQRDYLLDGEIPIIDQGHNLIGGYSNDDSKKINCELPVIIFGDHTRNVKYINFNFCAGADGVKIIKPKPIYNTRFFYYLLVMASEKIDKGYARHYHHIEKMIVPLPPLAEQNRIVEKIEELFSEIDNGVKYLERVKKQLKIYRQSVLKAAFRGKLVTNCAFENTIVGKHIEKPVYGTSKKCTYEKNESSIPVYRIPNINTRHYIIDESDLKYREFSYDEYIKLRLEENDILIIRSNGSLSLVGRCAITKNLNAGKSFAGYLIRLRAKDELLDMSYLTYYLNSCFARTYIEKKAKSSNGINNINSKELQELPFLYCGIGQQRQIVSEIESRLSVCDKIEETVFDALNKAESLRQSILKKAFAGELV